MSRISSRFQERRPWVPLKQSPWQEALGQFLLTMSIVFGFWYIAWRWTSSLNFDALWFSLPLAAAETAAFLGLVLFSINLWSDRSPSPGAPPRLASECGMEGEHRPLSVDVFFATYSEDPELVRLGLRDAKRLEYPWPIDIRIHVLDDGRRPAMAAVAAEEGAGYISREDNAGFKAGNLRNAMGSTSGDFIVICDADTRPFPQMLSETLGYFRDPKMAWVQTPQWFCDIPPGVPLPEYLARPLGRAGRFLGRLAERVIGPVQVGEDPFGNDPQMFYDVILRRRNRSNAAFCCGAGSIHRREAVMEAALRQWSQRIEAVVAASESQARRLTGEAAIDEAVRQTMRRQSALDEEFTPYKFHVSEDIYTSIILHSDRERGWKSVQHPNVLSRMLSPSDLLSWTVQRFKYAGGTIDILFNDNPLLRRSGLTWPQRLMYATTFYSYLSPLWNVVFLGAPILFLLTGIAPLSSYSLDFFLNIIPFLLANELAQLVSAWGVSNIKGRNWYIAMFPLNLQALWSVVRGRKISFPVTPKDRQTGRFPRLVRWQLAVVGATLLALLWGWTAFYLGQPGYSRGAMIANSLWGLVNIVSLLPIIRAAFWQPDPVFETPILEEAAK